MQHELQKFLAVVESGNFTKAAQALHVSQPALSLAIRNLEKTVGHRLVVRGGGKVALTEAGKTVYDAARHVRLELDNLMQQLRDSEEEALERLRLGMIDSVGEMLFAKDPEIDVHHLDLTVNDSQKLIDAVRLDRLDMAFITRQLKSASDELTLRTVGKEPFVLVTVPDKFDEIKRQMSKNRLANMLSYSEQSNTYGLIVSTLRGHGIRMQPSVFSTDPYLLKSLCLASRGPTLLPFRMVSDELVNGDLVVVPLIFEREINVVYSTGKYINNTMREVIKTIRARLQTDIEACEKFTSI